ncbi:tumor necrosis factor receptor superfamily member 11B-like isoform X2 [Brachyhypopomus gauderio]|uniref:tumor necrosis factor receptor superfamily member 11B-like isoform X2 n=1 Tax=Brachyhypopomus gauderio TaxID=698409 RepID=UPI0040431C10
MFIFAVLSLVSISPAAARVNETTYMRVLPSTGQEIVCNRCAPGFHLRAHCTDTRQTECRRCSAGFYTEFWNYIPECLPCDSCFEHQVVKQPCTHTRNQVCECEEGFFWNFHFCKRHTVCGAGYVVKSKGTPYADTMCEFCQNGYYATGAPGNKVCVPHKTCRPEERLLLHGSCWHDNVCASCNRIVEKGWDGLIKPLLAELFAQQKPHRLQRFVNRFVLRDDGRRRISQRRSSSENYLLHAQEWLRRATPEQLIELPDKLTKINLNNLAANVENKIAKFREETKYCSNNIP